VDWRDRYPDTLVDGEVERVMIPNLRYNIRKSVKQDENVMEIFGE
jgi:hypothetical protein